MKIKWEGKNLKKMDLIGKNDPYVLITVNGETRQSSTCDGGGSKPVWGVDNAGETLRFEVETALSVEVACLDEDEGSSDDIQRLGVCSPQDVRPLPARWIGTTTTP